MWLHAFSAALQVVPLNGPLLAKSNCHICKRFVFPTDLCNPFTVLCPEKSGNKLIFCASGNVKQEEGELCVGQGAGCRQGGKKVDKAPSCAHTSLPGTFCPQKSSTHPHTSGVFWGRGSYGLGRACKRIGEIPAKSHTGR